MQTDEYGLHAHDTPREEGQEDRCGQDCLFCKTDSTDGVADGKAEGRSYIIYIENTTQKVAPFVLNNVLTTTDLFREIADRLKFNTDVIGLRFSPTRYGSPHQRFIIGALPSYTDTIYVNMYLRKHPKIP